MFKQRKTNILPIAFTMLIVLGVSIIALSWVARQKQVPRLRAPNSPYAVTLTADYANPDYYANLDMQRVATLGLDDHVEAVWPLESESLGTEIQISTAPTQEVKIGSSSAKLIQVMKGDAEIEMARVDESVRFKVVEPNPYLKVD